MWDKYLSGITDDMIDGIYKSSQEAHVDEDTPYMQFSNGVTVVFNHKLNKLQRNSEKKVQ